MESQSLGRTYLWVRRVIIVMTCLLCVVVLAAGVPVLLSGPVGVLNTLMQWVAFGASVLYAVWVYKLHQDLRRLVPEYPVSPGYAMALLLIPVYNIWGIWAMWMAVSDHLPAPMWRGRRLPRVSLLVSLNYVAALLFRHRRTGPEGLRFGRIGNTKALAARHAASAFVYG